MAGGCTQGGSTFLPLRVNQAGVIPIIFAVSILLFPSQLADYFHDRARSRSSPTSRGGIVAFFDQHGAPT